jgi:hypothetical protein
MVMVKFSGNSGWGLHYSKLYISNGTGELGLIIVTINTTPES